MGKVKLTTYFDLKKKYYLCVKQLKFFATYKKDPPEIMKDDFAYDRLLLFFQEESQKTLQMLGEDDGKGTTTKGKS